MLICELKVLFRIVLAICMASIFLYYVLHLQWDTNSLYRRTVEMTHVRLSERSDSLKSESTFLTAHVGDPRRFALPVRSESKRIPASIESNLKPVPAFSVSPKLRSSPLTTPADVMITIRTCNANHKKRLKIMLDTWVSLIPNQVYAISDDEDVEFSQLMADGHLLASHCPNGHDRRDLCCKNSLALTKMVENIDKYHWFCRGDDDVYWNPSGLAMLLNTFDWTEPHVVGRRQRHMKVIRLKDPEDRHERKRDILYPVGHGGACVSRALLAKLAKYVVGKGFENFCMAYKVNDDIAMAAIPLLVANVVTDNGPTMYGHPLGELLRVPKQNHTDLSTKPLNTIANADYVFRGGVMHPVVTFLQPAFDRETDPTRVYTLHCHLNPTTPYCAALFSNYTSGDSRQTLHLKTL